MELHEGKWIRKSNGQSINIDQMSDDHIDNVIKLIEQGVSEYEWLCWCGKYGKLKVRELEKEINKRKGLVSVK